MTDTKTKILDLAESLTQERGFGGFSYLDIAEAIGIKSASVHYHFKCKDDLALALVERTHEKHAKTFSEMNAAIKSPKKRLEGLIEYFQSYARDDKFCLCGMMAAEFYYVTPEAHTLLDQYFRDFEGWIEQQFKEMKHKNAKRKALSFLSALEGSLLLARLRKDPQIIKDALKDHF